MGVRVGRMGAVAAAQQPLLLPPPCIPPPPAPLALHTPLPRSAPQDGNSGSDSSLHDDAARAAGKAAMEADLAADLAAHEAEEMASKDGVVVGSAAKARGPEEQYHVVCSLGDGIYTQWQSRVVSSRGSHGRGRRCVMCERGLDACVWVWQ